MKLIKKSEKEIPREIELTRYNIEDWPNWNKLLECGKVVIDARGKLRYPHGAPVGKLILAKIKKDGTPVYNESAEEWFDPDSPKAHQFEWPK